MRLSRLWRVVKKLALVVSCVLVGGYFYRSCSELSETTRTHAAPPSPTRDLVGVGQMGRIVKECPAMRTEAGWDEFRKAQLAGNTRGAATAMMAGGAFLAAGTAVTVLDNEMFKSRVRVADGPLLGAAFYLKGDCLGSR